MKPPQRRLKPGGSESPPSWSPTASPMLHFGWFVGHGFGVQGWGTPGYGMGYDWKKPVPVPGRRPGLRTLRPGPVHHRGFPHRARHLRRQPRRSTLDAGVLRAEARSPGPGAVPARPPPNTSAIVPTVSASFYPPFTAARLLATLQHFSHRAAGLERGHLRQRPCSAELRPWTSRSNTTCAMKRPRSSWTWSAGSGAAGPGHHCGGPLDTGIYSRPHQGPSHPPRRRVLQGPWDR